MPELPDIVTYIAALESRIIGQRLIQVRVASTFLLRSAQPPIHEVEGRVVRELRRVGKRIAIGVENDLWLVLHLMIAGRLHWRPPQASLAGRGNLDRKSTRLNSSHLGISYAVFCLKKKTTKKLM